MGVMPQRKPELDATKVPSGLEVAWAAGVYEGEGTCRNAGKTKRGIMISVTQKDPEILHRLRDLFGGSVRDNGTGNGIHVWDACGDRARVFLGMIYEWLSARRKTQVDATGALEFLQGVSPQGKSQAELRDALLAHYERHFRDKYVDNNSSRRERYQERMKNEIGYAEKVRASGKASRERKKQRIENGSLFAIA